MITIDNNQYKLIVNYREGFDLSAFEARYSSEVLEKYDYIVGDIGADMLRLKGFYKDKKMKRTQENHFSAIQDYLLEYCNFGCRYFILEKQRS